MGREQLFVKVLLRGLSLFLICVVSVAEAKRPLMHSIDYYARPGWDPNTMTASGILCLTTGVGLRGNSGGGMGANIGHSALSLFELEGTNRKSKNPESYKVTSVGFWPEKGSDRGDDSGRQQWQVENNSGDHFLTFSNSTLYGPQNGRHCVQVTDKDKTALNEFFKRKKEKKWNIFYNCNDLSVEAFLGVLFGWKSMEEHRRDPRAQAFLEPIREIVNVMTPHVVLKGIRNFQKDQQIKGTLRYVARDEDEIAKLQELDEGARITIPLFHGVPAKAVLPVVKENRATSGYKKNGH